MEALTSARRKELRGMAHHLDPVIQVGKSGVSARLLEELDRALRKHELLKVKFVEHKEERAELAEELAQRTRSHLVGRVGNIAILYRQAPPKKPSGTKREQAARTEKAAATGRRRKGGS